MYHSPGVDGCVDNARFGHNFLRTRPYWSSLSSEMLFEILWLDSGHHTRSESSLIGCCTCTAGGRFGPDYCIDLGSTMFTGVLSFL